MTPNQRRVLQAILHKVFAIAFVGPVLLAFIFVYGMGFACLIGRAFGFSASALVGRAG